MFVSRHSAARYLVMLIIALSTASLMPSQTLAARACPMAMYKRADLSLVGARSNWHSLLKHYSVFASCDDGGLAEGYSDAVVKLIANRWDHFGVFVNLSKRNPGFGRWALLHIDATTANQDLEKIMVNTATCIRDARNGASCRAVRKAAADALVESRQALSGSRSPT